MGTARGGGGRSRAAVRNSVLSRRCSDSSSSPQQGTHLTLRVQNKTKENVSKKGFV